MDSLTVFLEMRRVFREVDRQCARFAPLFRDGTAKATWLDDGVNYAFDSWEAQLTLLWLLSDPNKTITDADFAVGAEALAAFGIDYAASQSRMVERNRSKLLAFFRVDMEDDALAVGTRLVVVQQAMQAARTTASSLLDTSGDPQTTKYVTIGGVRKAEGKTLTDMGIDGSALADALDAVRAAVATVVRV